MLKGREGKLRPWCLEGSRRGEKGRGTRAKGKDKGQKGEGDREEGGREGRKRRVRWAETAQLAPNRNMARDRASL